MEPDGTVEWLVEPVDVGMSPTASTTGPVALPPGAALDTELRLSEMAAPPSVIASAVAEFGNAEEPVVERYTDVDGLHYLLLASLPEGRVISVTVPPRYRTGRVGTAAVRRGCHD